MLAIGLVVDDAIVVVEAVEHHIEEGMSPRDATLKAMEEVSGPVVSIALILASVFIPVGFMSGIQGRLNKQFAITIAISVMISAFNALTLSPALSAMLLRPRKAVARAARAASSAASTAGSRRRRSGYVGVSHGLIRKAVVGDRAAASAFAVVARRARPAAADELPARGGLRLLPAERAAAAGGVARADRRGAAARSSRSCAQTEGVANFNTIAGFSLLTRVTASNYGFYFVGLKPWDERSGADSTRARSSTA